MECGEGFVAGLREGGEVAFGGAEAGVDPNPPAAGSSRIPVRVEPTRSDYVGRLAALECPGSAGVVLDTTSLQSIRYRLVSPHQAPTDRWAATRVIAGD